MDTKTREHQWVEIKVTPVALALDDENQPIAIPNGEDPEVTVGCFVCNMGMDEGSGINCPGQDLFD